MFKAKKKKRLHSGVQGEPGKVPRKQQGNDQSEQSYQGILYRRIGPDLCHGEGREGAWRRVTLNQHAHGGHKLGQITAKSAHLRTPVTFMRQFVRH